MGIDKNTVFSTYKGVFKRDKNGAIVSLNDQELQIYLKENKDSIEVALLKEKDNINHPVHYNKHPSNVECIQITEHMNFCLGNAIKYIWRAGQKGNYIEDLKKAIFYLEREISREAKRSEEK